MMEHKNEFVEHSDNICKIVKLPCLCKKRFNLSIDSVWKASEIQEYHYDYYNNLFDILEQNKSLVSCRL